MRQTLKKTVYFHWKFINLRAVTCENSIKQENALQWSNHFQSEDDRCYLETASKPTTDTDVLRKKYSFIDWLEWVEPLQYIEEKVEIKEENTIREQLGNWMLKKF